MELQTQSLTFFSGHVTMVQDKRGKKPQVSEIKEQTEIICTFILNRTDPKNDNEKRRYYKAK